MSKKEFKKYVGTEGNMQKTVAILLNLSGLLWFHCPNGGTRNKREAVTLKRQGVKAGVPDCLILTPKGKYRGMAIELKVGKNKPTDYQKTWLKDLQKAGFLCVVSYSVEEVEYIIEQYKKGLLK